MPFFWYSLIIDLSVFSSIENIHVFICVWQIWENSREERQVDKYLRASSYKKVIRKAFNWPGRYTILYKSYGSMDQEWFILGFILDIARISITLWSKSHYYLPFLTPFLTTFPIESWIFNGYKIEWILLLFFIFLMSFHVAVEIRFR